MPRLLFAFILLTAPMIPTAQAETTFSARHERLLKNFEQICSFLDDGEWWEFFPRWGDQPELEHLLDEAVDRIVPEIDEWWPDGIERIEADLADGNDRRAGLAAALDGAPDCSASFWKLDRCAACANEPNSVDHIQCRLDPLDEEIEGYRAEREEAILEFMSDIRERYGLGIGEDQAAFILHGANGADAVGGAGGAGGSWPERRLRASVILNGMLILDAMTDIERYLAANGGRVTPDDADGHRCGVVEIGRLIHFRMLERNM